MIPSIETAKGVINAYSIAKTVQRVNALVFGVFDFLYDMRLDYDENDGIEYAYARAKKSLLMQELQELPLLTASGKKSTILMG